MEIKLCLSGTRKLREATHILVTSTIVELIKYINLEPGIEQLIKKGAGLTILVKSNSFNHYLFNPYWYEFPTIDKIN